MTHPVKFRKHVLSVRKEEGLTFEETAKRFKVGRASLTRWSKNIELAEQPPRSRKIDMDALRKDVELHPDAYQYERAERFDVTQESIHAALKRLGVSIKKNAATSKSRRRKTELLSKAD